MSQKATLKDHLKFSREELPALFGVLGTVVLLHIVGWGLFIHYNSDPRYHSLVDGKGALIYAGAGALAYSHGNIGLGWGVRSRVQESSSGAGGL